MTRRRWRLEVWLGAWLLGFVLLGQATGCTTLIAIAACENCGKSADPYMLIVGPEDGATVTGSIPVSLGFTHAGIDAGVAQIDIMVDGALTAVWSNGSQNPIQILPEGGSRAVELRYIVRNAAGENMQEMSETVDWHPTVFISFLDCSSGTCGPLQLETLSGTATLRVVLAEDMSLVQSVHFSIDTTANNDDTTAPFEASVDTTAFSNGSHSLVADIDLGGTYQLSAMATINIGN